MDSFVATLACVLELALAAPGAVMALMPVRKHLRPPTPTAYAACALCLVIFVAAGEAACTATGWPPVAILSIGALLLFVPYSRIVSLPFAKKVFCYANAAMICVLARLYGLVISAPWEVGNDTGLLMPQTAAVTLGVAAALGLAFTKTLLVKLPDLMENDAIGGAWRLLAAAPALTTLAVSWMMPWHPELLLVGRIRPVMLALTLLMPTVAWTFFHIAWRVMKRVSEEDSLRREVEILRMEERRLRDIRSYVDQTRALRHDFRHHLLAMRGMLEDGRTAELESYLNQLSKVEEESRTPQLCKNAAVDAVAARYDAVARERGVAVTWRFELPERLPVAEVDLCSVLGNLVENAIRAASRVEGRLRTVDVVAREISPLAIGLTVRNPHGTGLRFGEDGLPASDEPGHGVGLASVSNVANRYGGTVDAHDEAGKLTVGVILFHE